MNKKIPLWVALSAGLVFSAAVMVATLMYAAYNYGLLQSNDATAILTKLQTMRHDVSIDFYKDIDAQKLEDATLKGFMAGLGDKYAAYYTAEETKLNTADTEGRNVGIGASYFIDSKTGYMFVERVHSGSPAEKAGLNRGDRIVSIGGTDVNASNYSQLVAGIRDVSKAVSLGVKKANGSNATVEIQPAEYTGQSVWLEMLGSTALITIAEFDDTTPDQLKAAIDKSIAAENVIFDLRGNPGGTVNSVCSCLDYLLPSGDLVVATYKGGSSKVIRTSDESAALHKPAVV
ncbi:MAG: PDZ domain-containing protein, partial [Clostridia bacterium]|nr:PDZ domain-containing protein [Clostridia bacterium]